MTDEQKLDALEACLRELSAVRESAYDDPKSVAWRDNSEKTVQEVFGRSSVEFHTFIRARDHVYNVLLTREQMQATYDDKLKSQEEILRRYIRRFGAPKSN